MLSFDSFGKNMWTLSKNQVAYVLAKLYRTNYFSKRISSNFHVLYKYLGMLF